MPKIWWRVLALFAIALIATCVAVRSMDWSQVYQDRADSVVAIYNPDTGMGGSGVAINIKVFVTNNHVVEAVGSNMVVQTRSGEKMSGSVVYRDEKHDVARVRVEGTLRKFARINTEPLTPGQETLQITTFGDRWMALVGHVMEAERNFDNVEGDKDRKLVNIYQFARPGISGGGVFNQAGELIAIGSTYQHQGQHSPVGLIRHPVPIMGAIPSKYLQGSKK